jgi:potassium-transporting ATPase KdpC subunit
MKNTIKQSLKISIFLLVLCGVIYPLAVTGLGQIMFHKQANGSIIEYNNKAVGSKLIGQNFTDTRFFHGRVSSINYNTYTKEDIIPKKDGSVSYTGVSSGSSNLAPSNKALTDRINKDVDAFLKANPTISKDKIPADLFTNSGSGLDPDISPEGAQIQIPLISQVTKISVEDLNKIVKDNTTGKSLGVFGEAHVNVLKCNLDISKKLNIK